MKFRAVSAALAVQALLLGGALLVAPTPAAAQKRVSNVVPEAAAYSLQATIGDIDMSTRHVTLITQSGGKVSVTAGPHVRLEMLKAGDTVNTRFYRSVAFWFSPPGQPVPEDQIAQVVARPVEVPGGVHAKVTRMSAVVVALDLTHKVVDVVAPGGGEVYSVAVTDPERQKALSKLKVGDTITAVVSETLAVAIDPAK